MRAEHWGAGLDTSAAYGELAPVLSDPLPLAGDAVKLDVIRLALVQLGQTSEKC